MVDPHLGIVGVGPSEVAHPYMDEIFGPRDDVFRLGGGTGIVVRGNDDIRRTGVIGRSLRRWRQTVVQGDTGIRFKVDERKVG